MMVAAPRMPRRKVAAASSCSCGACLGKVSQPRSALRNLAATTLSLAGGLHLQLFEPASGVPPTRNYGTDKEKEAQKPQLQQTANALSSADVRKPPPSKHNEQEHLASVVSKVAGSAEECPRLLTPSRAGAAGRSTNKPKVWIWPRIDEMMMSGHDATSQHCLIPDGDQAKDRSAADEYVRTVKASRRKKTAQPGDESAREVGETERARDVEMEMTIEEVANPVGGGKGHQQTRQQFLGGGVVGGASSWQHQKGILSSLGPQSTALPSTTGHGGDMSAPAAGTTTTSSAFGFPFQTAGTSALDAAPSIQNNDWADPDGRASDGSFLSAEELHDRWKRRRTAAVDRVPFEDAHAQQAPPDHLPFHEHMAAVMRRRGGGAEQGRTASRSPSPSARSASCSPAAAGTAGEATSINGTFSLARVFRSLAFSRQTSAESAASAGGAASPQSCEQDRMDVCEDAQLSPRCSSARPGEVRTASRTTTDVGQLYNRRRPQPPVSAGVRLAALLQKGPQKMLSTKQVNGAGSCRSAAATTAMKADMEQGLQRLMDIKTRAATPGFLASEAGYAAYDYNPRGSRGFQSRDAGRLGLVYYLTRPRGGPQERGGRKSGAEHSGDGDVGADVEVGECGPVKEASVAVNNEHVEQRESEEADCSTPWCMDYLDDLFAATREVGEDPHRDVGPLPTPRLLWEPSGPPGAGEGAKDEASEDDQVFSLTDHVLAAIAPLVVRSEELRVASLAREYAFFDELRLAARCQSARETRSHCCASKSKKTEEDCTGGPPEGCVNGVALATSGKQEQASPPAPAIDADCQMGVADRAAMEDTPAAMRREDGGREVVQQPSYNELSTAVAGLLSGAFSTYFASSGGTTAATASGVQQCCSALQMPYMKCAEDQIMHNLGPDTEELLNTPVSSRDLSAALSGLHLSASSSSEGSGGQGQLPLPLAEQAKLRLPSSNLPRAEVLKPPRPAGVNEHIEDHLHQEAPAHFCQRPCPARTEEVVKGEAIMATHQQRPAATLLTKMKNRAEATPSEGGKVNDACAPGASASTRTEAVHAVLQKHILAEQAERPEDEKAQHHDQDPAGSTSFPRPEQSHSLRGGRFLFDRLRQLVVSGAKFRLTRVEQEKSRTAYVNSFGSCSSFEDDVDHGDLGLPEHYPRSPGQVHLQAENFRREVILPSPCSRDGYFALVAAPARCDWEDAQFDFVCRDVLKIPYGASAKRCSTSTSTSGEMVRYCPLSRRCVRTVMDEHAGAKVQNSVRLAKQSYLSRGISMEHTTYVFETAGDAGAADDAVHHLFSAPAARLEKCQSRSCGSNSKSKKCINSSYVKIEVTLRTEEGQVAPTIPMKWSSGALSNDHRCGGVRIRITGLDGENRTSVDGNDDCSAPFVDLWL